MRDHLANPRREREDDATAHSGVEGPNEPDFIDQERLNYEVLDALKPLHEAWCQCELEPTSVYGVRLYREGATLVDHLDVPETHVISSILHIDSKLDAPFPIEIQDVTGDYAAVDPKARRDDVLRVREVFSWEVHTDEGRVLRERVPPLPAQGLDVQ